jgi:hypothetical protein
MQRPKDPGLVGIAIFAVLGGAVVAVCLFAFKLYLQAGG